MFGKSFNIAIQIFRDLFQSDAGVLCHEHQYGYSPVIGSALEMTLELFGCFYLQIIIHLTILAHSHILENVRMILFICYAFLNTRKTMIRALDNIFLLEPNDPPAGAA